MKIDSDIDWSRIAPPLSFDTEEHIRSFAEQVYYEHERIAAQYTCFAPSGGQNDEEIIGRIESVAANCFGTFFEVSPQDRYSDVFEQASRLALHLAKDHIFADGNKRTALVVALAIVKMRSVDLQIEDSVNPADNTAYRWIQDAVSDSGDEGALADNLRGMARPDSCRGADMLLGDEE